ncbi:MAG: glutathione peroxidase [Clostridia bacterium]|nr:glutathione peroxidase [Clostridia bacterium]
MSIYDIAVKTRSGEEVLLSEYAGKVLLIVNTATGCGFTPQYEGLEKLYEAYHEKGLEILDFPCNQFKGQAPGSDEEIHSFCTLKYNTQFDQFKKIDVNGENEAPLYTFLKAKAPAEEVQGLKNKLAMKAIAKLSDTAQTAADIQWNFTKFLVDKEGNVIKRYDPTCKPEEIEKDIIKAL